MTQIENLCKTLGISPKEAQEIINADFKIEKGQTLSNLSEEQKKVIKSARQADRKTGLSYQFSKRKEAKNPTKAGIIELIAGSLSASGYEQIEIVNAEREISFLADGKKYKITLSAPRK